MPSEVIIYGEGGPPVTDTGTNDPTVTLQQSQSTPEQSAPGAVPYTAPVVERYDIRQIQEDAKAAAYVQAITQGKSPAEAENIASAAGNNAGTAALAGIGNQGGTAATGTVGTAPNAASSPGFGVANDDNSNGANNIYGTNAVLNATGQPGALIQPRPNILDQYASYTYNIGWYLLTPTQYKAMIPSAKIEVNTWSLLAQSGGASQQQTGAVTGQKTLDGSYSQSVATPGRNPYFTLDYYFEDLEINSFLAGSKGPAQQTTITFKIIEPNGITLLPNLNKAVRELYQDIDVSPRAAHYCIVIKFYGWDINGNLITDPTKNQGEPGATPNNTNSIATRFYPLIINTVNYKIQSKNVEYEISGVCPGYEYGFSSATGSIPYNIALAGETVKEMLSGNGSNNTVPLNSNGNLERDSYNTPAPDQQNTPVQKQTTQQEAIKTVTAYEAGLPPDSIVTAASYPGTY
jgi:hypothetical protein